MKNVSQIVAGWILLVAVFYYYVVRQWYLIGHTGLLIGVLGIGVFISFLFSALEMALATLSSEDLKKLQAESKKLDDEHDAGTIDDREHAGGIRQVADIVDIYFNKDRLNPPLTIGSNISNVVMASFAPLSIAASVALKPIQIDFRWAAALLDCTSDCSLDLPGAGKETLTFFVVFLLVMVFGEIMPKKIGLKYNLWFVKKFRVVLRVLEFLFGWLGVALLSPVSKL